MYNLKIKRFLSVALILLISSMFLTACSRVPSENSSTFGDGSQIGDDSPTSSEVSDWLSALEEWDNSSTTSSGTTSETSSDTDGTTSTTTSTTTSNDKNSYENGGNWTQGWH